MNNNIDTASDLRDLIVIDPREVFDEPTTTENYLFTAIDDDRFDVPLQRELH